MNYKVKILDENYQIDFDYSKIDFRLNNDYFSYNILYEKNFQKINVKKFLVEKNGIGILYCPLFVSKNSIFNFEKYIYPPIFAKNQDHKTYVDSAKLFFDYIENKYKTLKKNYIIYESSYNTDNVYKSLIAKEKKYISSLYEYFINLDDDLNIIKKNFRKSYKSLIKLENDQNIEVISGKNSLEKFFMFRLLHKKRNGITRDEHTWGYQLNQLCNNKSFLILLFQDKILISGAYFELHEEIVYYSISCSVIGQKNKGLSHKIIYKAIEFSKLNLKKKRLVLGDVLNKVEDNEIKKLNISFFKKGFSNTFIEKKIFS